jgi:hypothetical protein
VCADVSSESLAAQEVCPTFAESAEAAEKFPSSGFFLSVLGALCGEIQKAEWLAPSAIVGTSKQPLSGKTNPDQD